MLKHSMREEHAAGWSPGLPSMLEEKGNANLKAQCWALLPKPAFGALFLLGPGRGTRNSTACFSDPFIPLAEAL